MSSTGAALSSTVREVPGKSPGNSQGSSGKCWEVHCNDSGGPRRKQSGNSVWKLTASVMLQPFCRSFRQAFSNYSFRIPERMVISKAVVSVSSVFGRDGPYLRQMPLKPHEWPLKLQKWAFKASKNGNLRDWDL